MLAALAASAGERVRVRRDGLEEWVVTVAAGTLRLFVPVAGADPYLTLARDALLHGRCPACRPVATISASYADVTHQKRCPAYQFLD